MKKLLTLAFITMLCIACSVEEETTPNEGTNLDIVLENYKGVFTTADGQIRGTLDVTLAEDNLSASGTLTLSTGEIVMIDTDQITDLGNRKELTFNSNDLSFVMTTGEEGEIMEVNTVTFRGNESAILVGQSTERDPLNPVLGTYVCTMCPPPLDNMLTQTFNLVIAAPDMSGNSTITSQTTLGGTIYNGIATQSGCVVNGGQTTCNLNSGVIPGSTGTAFNPGGGPVTWSGTHTFDNGPSGPNNCSTVSGTWTWQASTIGTVGGTFASNSGGDCPPPLTTLIFEDFEDSTVGYILRDPATGTVLPEDTDEIEFEDYFGRVALADFETADMVGFSNIQGTRFFGSGDSDAIDAPSPLTGLDVTSINWEGINTSGLSNITVSAFFAEANASDGNEDWDLDSSVRIEYSFDAGASWTSVFAIESSGIPSSTAGTPRVDTNLDSTGNGAEISAAFSQHEATFAVAGSTMNVRIIMAQLDAADEDVAFDNVTISGN
ncbi:hypothetical protein ACFO3O_10310 [Dokdonia ponticola]|uniref:DUF5689 domain-containing protein n=1 Tax=Dokdonia ponticola TaxID=2041041 RepID=A0ABV9HWX1_9FLAO